MSLPLRFFHLLVFGFGCCAPLAAQGQGAVSSCESHATAAGIEVLEQGGNAVDAAVAVGFALAVTFPGAGNLGGGGFFLYRSAHGEALFLDFREVAPASAFRDMYRDPAGKVDRAASRVGWKAVGVPGSVPGLLWMHERFGRLSRQQVLRPAIRLAAYGFHLSDFESRRLRRVRDYLRLDPLAQRVFLDAEQGAVPAGAWIQQPRLAGTLTLIASQGVRAFQEGPLVEELVRLCSKRGGILTAEDFKNYEPLMRPVHHFDWAGYQVLAASPPSSGGLFLQQVLYFLGGFPLREWGFQDPRTVQTIGEAAARAFSDRNRWLGDPEGFDFNYLDLVTPEYLERKRKEIDPLRFTPAKNLNPADIKESSETTHYSVVDSEGAACAVTTTLNGSYGSKVMAPGGFFMNNEMDDFATAPNTPNQFGLVQGAYNAIHPGRRPLSSMSPIIILREDRVEAVLGSPGGPRILTSVLQVLLNRFIFGMSPQQAVFAPRFHRQDLPESMEYEPERFSEIMLEALQALGQPLKERATYVGNVNAIFRVGDTWQAVADFRREGSGMTVRMNQN